MTDPNATAVQDVPTIAAAEDDDWLTGVEACAVDAGEDCEACQ